MTNSTTFETGNIYQMRFVTDSQLRPEFICMDRTPKTATFYAIKGNDVIKRKIRIDSEGFEYIVDGSYSMAPSINSKKVVG